MEFIQNLTGSLFWATALSLGLYLYGDLFVVRWKRGSFPGSETSSG